MISAIVCHTFPIAEKLQNKDSLSDLAIENFIESFIIHLDETSDEEDFSTVG